MDTYLGQLPLGGMVRARCVCVAGLWMGRDSGAQLARTLTHSRTHYTRAGLRAAGTGDAGGGAYASACQSGAG